MQYLQDETSTSNSLSRHERDRRVIRSKAAALEAARSLFLAKGYAGTTMDDIAAAAGISRRTLYNNFPDKESIFIQIVESITKIASDFANGLEDQFGRSIDHGSLATELYDLGERLAMKIVRPEVVVTRRLLIGEARIFPMLVKKYFDAAPGKVITALSKGFARLSVEGLLKVDDPRRAAAQYAYLIAGEHLDRAVLTGSLPSDEEILECARSGVETFLARFANTVSPPIK